MKPHTIALLRAFIRQTRGALAAIEMWIGEEEAYGKNLQSGQQYVIVTAPDGARRLGRAKKDKPHQQTPSQASEQATSRM